MRTHIVVKQYADTHAVVVNSSSICVLILLSPEKPKQPQKHSSGPAGRHLYFSVTARAASGRLAQYQDTYILVRGHIQRSMRTHSGSCTCQSRHAHVNTQGAWSLWQCFQFFTTAYYYLCPRTTVYVFSYYQMCPSTQRRMDFAARWSRGKKVKTLL